MTGQQAPTHLALAACHALEKTLGTTEFSESVEAAFEKALQRGKAGQLGRQARSPQ